MGKRQKQLSQAEVWDDSALLSSWNDALAEYKLYHSIHARGERVEDVLREFEAKADTQNGTMVAKEGDSVTATNSGPINGIVDDDLEDGEVREENESDLQQGTNALPLPTHSHPDDSNITEQSSSGPNIIQIATSNTKDEALKNLMISWFYAGYYTKAYEGQQESRSTANKDSDQSGKMTTEEAIPRDGSS